MHRHTYICTWIYVYMHICLNLLLHWLLLVSGDARSLSHPEAAFDSESQLLLAGLRREAEKTNLGCNRIEYDMIEYNIIFYIIYSPLEIQTEVIANIVLRQIAGM